jgi:hypothetical protein
LETRLEKECHGMVVGGRGGGLFLDFRDGELLNDEFGWAFWRVVVGLML